MLTKAEEEQYNRHLILPEIGAEGQLKLKKAKVLVIGAGGLGCPILQYLAAAGVGNIGIIDDDTVAVSNLQRQILYSYNDIGKYKAKVAAEKLAQLNRFVTFNVFTEKLTTKNAINLFKQYDVIVDGCDNFQTRYLVNDAAVLTKKPVVSGAIFKFEGQVSVFNYKNGATYRCLYPNPPKPNEVPNCSEIGVLGVLAGIIGSLQVNEVIKIICGIGEVLSGKLATYNTLSSRQMLFSFKKNERILITELEENYDFFCGFTAEINEILKEDFFKEKERYNLLDVRTYEERNGNTIGGTHIPLDELSARISELKTDKPLVVYCKSGNRSKQAIEILKNLEFSSTLFNLKNGTG